MKGLYPEIIYSAIGELQEGGIPSGEYHSGYLTNDMVKAFLANSHERLIQATLYSKNSGLDTLQTILDSYIKQGRLGDVLNFLKENSNDRYRYDLENFVSAMVEKSSDAFILEFLSLGEEALGYIEQIISGLYKNGRREFANKLIAEYAGAYEQSIIKTTYGIISGDKTSQQQMLKELEVLFSGEVDSDDIAFLFNDPVILRANRLVDALRDRDYDMEVLKNIYTRVRVESAKRSKYGNSGDYELEGKIREYLLEQENYDEALEFIEVCGDRHYYKTDVLMRKLVTGNLEEQEAQRVIREISDIQDEQITEKEKEREEDNEYRDKHKDRVDLYQAHATKFSYFVVYELLYGSQEKADEYIAQMVDWVDKIRVPGDPNAPIEHIKWSRWQSKRAKREIREMFYGLGLLECLPRNGGWSDTMQDPQIREERLKEKKKAKEDKCQKRESEGYIKNAHTYTDEVLAYMRLINDDKIKEAIDLLIGNTQFGINSTDWIGASLILQKRPKSFLKIFEICTQCTKKSYRGASQLRGMEHFLFEAVKLGSFEEVELSDKFTSSFLKSVCYDKDSGFTGIPGDVIVGLINRLIKIGEVEKAWKIYNFFKSDVGKGYDWKVVPREAEDTCMGLFLRAISKEGDGGGISKSLRGQIENIPEGDRVEYHNTEVEISLALLDVEKANEQSSSLLSCIDTPNKAREWVKLMQAGTLRDTHRKKDEILGVYASSDDEHIRWRMIDAMIDAKMPGVEAMPEIQSKDTPLRVTKYFIKKLVYADILHQFTGAFLNGHEHIPYLRRLLAEYQNEFNTVIETLESLYERDNLGLYQEGEFNSDITIQEYQDIEDFYKNPNFWDNIFLVLREVGMFTPGIYMQAQEVGFERDKLARICNDVAEMKAKLFTNNAINDEISPDLLAEIIYAAYRPANISLGDVRSLCRRLRDCTHHLNSYQFERGGYKLDFRPRKVMKLRKGTKLDDRFDFQLARNMHHLRGQNTIRDSDDAKAIQLLARKLSEIGRLKLNDEIGVSDIIQLFGEDEYMNLLLGPHTGQTSEDIAYKTLIDAQEAYGVYFRDKVEEKINQFFFTNEAHISEMVTSFAQSLRTPKRMNVVKQQLSIDIEEYSDLDDSELAAKVIAAVILQKFKPLQDINRSIKREILKFVAEDGTDVAVSNKQYSAVLSKNISSFFAKSSAGICTAQDTNLFHREDHFHINIIDDEKQVCVGNIQAYIMDYNGKKHLLLRGFNPSTNLLKEVDSGFFCESIIDICRGFCKENELEGIILSEQGSFLALSNRGSIVSYLQRTYGRGEIEMPPFFITDGQSISKGYLLPA